MQTYCDIFNLGAFMTYEKIIDRYHVLKAVHYLLFTLCTLFFIIYLAKYYYMFFDFSTKEKIVNFIKILMQNYLFFIICSFIFYGYFWHLEESSKQLNSDEKEHLGKIKYVFLYPWIFFLLMATINTLIKSNIF